MTAPTKAPSTAAVGDPPDAPTLTSFGFTGTIDDGICSSGTLFFSIPAITNDSIGDFLNFYVNGAQAAGTLISQENVNRAFLLPVPVSPSFDFTGRASVYYVITKTKTPDNFSASRNSVYPVYRKGHPGPFINNDGLPPPAVIPSLYNQQSFQKGAQLNISVPISDVKRLLQNSLKPLVDGNAITVNLELFATTPDKSPVPYFYTVNIPTRTLSSTDVNALTLMFTVAAANLANIDENIGNAYYSLVQDGYFEQQSVRVATVIDVVPPHS